MQKQPCGLLQKDLDSFPPLQSTCSPGPKTRKFLNNWDPCTCAMRGAQMAQVVRTMETICVCLCIYGIHIIIYIIYTYVYIIHIHHMHTFVLFILWIYIYIHIVYMNYVWIVYCVNTYIYVFIIQCNSFSLRSEISRKTILTNIEEHLNPRHKKNEKTLGDSHCLFLLCQRTAGSG
jgi:hypothetical protein